MKIQKSANQMVSVNPLNNRISCAAATASAYFPIAFKTGVGVNPIDEGLPRRN